MSAYFQKNKYLVFAYFSLWLLMAAGFFYFLVFWSGKYYMIALTDTLISTISLFILMPFLWQVFRYSVQNNANQVLSKLPVALIAGALLVIVWLYSSQVMIVTATGNSQEYYEFLNHTLVPRAIWGGLATCIMYLLLLVLYLQNRNQDEKQRALQLEDLVRQTELHALKNQLNPHFMYNSLNSISSLTHSNPDKAREMIICLSDFLRYALKQNAMQMTSLGNELENVKLYLNIEKIRFGDRLQTCFKDVKENMLNLEVPVMILQPLFENSIKHGVQNNPGIVKIQFSVNENNDNYVTYSVSNPYDSDFARFKAEGVGLSNIRNRLRLIYGNGKLLSITAGQNTFTASLTIPKRIFRE